jgi:hypothetical protein
MMKNLLQSPLLALHAMRRDTSSLHGPSFTCARQSAHDAAAKEGGEKPGQRDAGARASKQQSFALLRCSSCLLPLRQLAARVLC